MQGIKIFILQWMGLYFNPALHAYPSPWREVEKPAKKPKPVLPTEQVHHVAGRTYVDTPPPAEAHSQWTEADMGALKGRVARLIDADHAQLAAAELTDLAKAAEIKALWAKDLTIKAISQELTRRHKKGCSVSSVSRFTSCFSKAVESGGVVGASPAPAA